MPQPVSTAAHGNAPLSAAGNPDAAARVAMVNHAAVNDEPRDVRAGKALLGGTVTIDRPRELLYSFWRDFNNLPRFMHNIEHVSSDGSVRSHWVVAAPAGQTLEWDAAMVEDRPGRLISWKSLDGASVDAFWRNNRGDIAKQIHAASREGALLGLRRLQR